MDTIFSQAEWVARRLRNLRIHADKLVDQMHFHSVLKSQPFWNTMNERAANEKLSQLLCRSSGNRLSSLAQMIPRMHDGNLSFKELTKTGRELIEDATLILPAMQAHSPSAIIASNDFRAARYYRLLRVLGFSIPSKISLISYDNSPLLRPFPISSIDFGLTSLGFQMFHSFFDYIPLQYFGRNGNMIWGESRLNHTGSITSRL